MREWSIAVAALIFVIFMAVIGQKQELTPSPIPTRDQPLQKQTEAIQSPLQPSQPTQATFVVAPGKFVGKFLLGVTKENILKTAPKPQENSSDRLVYKNQKTGNILVAHFQDNKMVQIDFTNQGFKTAEGINAGNFRDAQYASLFDVQELPGASLRLKYTLKTGGLTFYGNSDSLSRTIGVVHAGQYPVVSRSQQTEVRVQPALEPQQTSKYQRALQDYEERNYEAAAVNFKQYLQQTPKSPLAGNAQYLIGESRYAQKQYEAAIVAYDEVVQKYSQDPKVAAAMLKQGYAFAELKDARNARFFLQQVQKKYPNSLEAQQAQNKLREIEALGRWGAQQREAQQQLPTQEKSLSTLLRENYETQMRLGSSAERCQHASLMMLGMAKLQVVDRNPLALQDDHNIFWWKRQQLHECAKAGVVLPN